MRDLPKSTDITGFGLLSVSEQSAQQMVDTINANDSNIANVVGRVQEKDERALQIV